MTHLLEAVRVEKVQEVKQLFKIVLKRGASEQQLVFEVIATQHTKELQYTHTHKHDR